MLRTLYLIFCLLGFFPLATTAATNPPTLLVWGDSLSAAYGIPVEKGWVNLLQQKVGGKFTVINGSISGETSAGGLTRLPEALKEHQPAYLLLELGANDGLRGIDLPTLRSNLEQMIKLAQSAGAKVVLVGIRLPPNFGATFTEKFAATYVELAKQYALPLVPFLLEGVADNWDLMQADGMHPIAEAEPQVLGNVWKVLEGVLAAEKRG